MKVSILGLSPTRDQAPCDGWEVWGMAWDCEALSMDRVFEMHDRSLVSDFARLNDCRRVYVQQAMPEAPEAIVYPFDEVAKTTGAYWCSSVGYMLALAIHEGATDIALYGVDGTEQYSYQHPNINFLIGLAMGKGINVHLPAGCPLLQFVSDPDFPYVERYGNFNAAL